MKVLYQFLWCILIICVMPYVGLAFLVWRPIAWILGLVFPGRDYFPIKRIWEGLCDWVNCKSGLDLESVLLLTALFLLAGTAIGAFVDLFRGRR